MSNSILSLAKKVLIYCKISDLRFQVFYPQSLSIIIEMNAYWLLLLWRGVLIRRFSETTHQLYRRTIMHPCIVTSLKSNLRCSVNVMQILITPCSKNTSEGYFWKVLQPEPTTKAFFNFRRYNLRTQTEYNTHFSRFWLLHNKVFFYLKST